MNLSTAEAVKILKQDSVSDSVIESCLVHDAAVVRANAILALTRLGRTDSRTVQLLRNAATGARNSVHLMGTVTVAFLAINGLLTCQSMEAKQIATELIRAYPEPEKQDLLRYLSGEGHTIAAL